MLFDRMNTKHLICMIFNERAAAIYNFSPRYFARSAIIVSNFIFINDIDDESEQIVCPGLALRL